MTSRQDLTRLLKEAMGEQDKLRVSVLRLLLAAIHNQEIEKKRELTREEIGLVVRKEAKNRRESINFYSQAGRKDLQEQEEAELAVLADFLPQSISEEKIRQLVQEIIKERNFSRLADFGLLMGQTMNRIGSGQDGSVVARIVKEELAKKATS
ncbi:MAG: GatB/YqeY domain-containing protein [Candidatus Shapirobacteria bacterium]|nr:GatB/YqeY domain-containing protein [Candidatus Shapirobacteria bacterium]MDD5073806.1 GatB/YqeY domain-containing protein [Candidatus Shapirobacteria bacterium]MDD5481509.1 GatB/YqeY domain-containing protein [Candidatus Shapirobacteria bacterium]